MVTGIREQRRVEGRTKILDTACDIVDRDGAAAVTIRAVASTSGFSAPVVYQHFDNKDALLLTVVERGFAELHTRLTARSHGQSGLHALLELTHGYLDFAQARPHLHRLMNGMSDIQINSPARHAAARPVIDLTLAAVHSWADGIDHSSRGTSAQSVDLATAADLVWGLVNGMSTLGLLNDIGFDRAHDLAEEGVRRLTSSWATAS